MYQYTVIFENSDYLDLYWILVKDTFENSDTWIRRFLSEYARFAKMKTIFMEIILSNSRNFKLHQYVLVNPSECKRVHTDFWFIYDIKF